jgi:hypothetical protein
VRLNRLLFLFCLLSLAMGVSPAHSLKSDENRWIFCQNALGNSEDLEKLQYLIMDAKASGFNGIVLSSYFDSLDLQSPEYIDRIRQLIAFCNQKAFNLIPCGFSIGYASALLSHDRNLAEGFPVRDLLFKVAGAKAVPYSPSRPSDELLYTADFEDLSRTGMALEDVGKITFRDDIVTHSGRSSLRFENFGYNHHGNARLSKDLDVTPFQSYKISFWYRAEKLTSGTPLMVQVYTTDGHFLISMNMEQPANAWQRCTLDFNSLEHTRVRIYLGVWGGQAGKLWIDDLNICQQKDLIRLIHRAGVPFKVIDALTGTAYIQGTDFDILESPQGSNSFLITINPHGHIRESSLLKVSYYRSYVMGNGQVCACMAAPEIYEIWKREVGLIEQLLHPKAYFLSMDEIRQGGYCGSCSKGDMARLLGQCITKQSNIIKSVNPGAKVYLWGDMLDPNMGATSYYCMTRGGFPNSWLYVPKDIIPVVWDYINRDKSLSHFVKNGFTPMGSICVDGDISIDNLKAWKKSLHSSRNNPGIMYTTWHHDYFHLKLFGETLFD